MLTDIRDRYTATGPVAPVAIPASLQASLLARLDHLAPVREGGGRYHTRRRRISAGPAGHRI